MSSPNTCRQLVTQLLSDLTYCTSLCNAILANRRLGRTHESFDRLYSSLEVSASEIQAQYNLLRKAIGSKMDLGDEKARSAMNSSVRDTQMEIRTRLSDIAYKRSDGRGSPEVPGFRELLRRWKIIEREVMDTLQGLAQRLGGNKTKHKSNDKKMRSTKTYEVQPAVETIYEEPHPTEEVTVRRQDLDTLLKHMKNSWVEKWVGGNVLYINKFDVSNTQWERPTGYIKTLSRSSGYSSESSSRDSTESRRSSAGSREDPRWRKTTRDDICYNPSGW